MRKARTSESVAGVLGHPVAHSVSPEIFAYLARKNGLSLTYQKFDCEPRALSTFIRDVRRKSYVGCNVTIPYKRAILKKLDLTSPEVRLIGSVNVIRKQGGQLKGFNTDIYGIKRTFIAHQVSPKGKTAVIFGAGGAARAAAYYLGQTSAKEVYISNRNQKRALALVREFSDRFPKTRFTVVGGGDVPQAQIFVQATPLGMAGFPSESPLRKVNGNVRGAFAFDVVYRPEQTPFLKSAKSLGMKTAGGLDMLVWQALKTWEIWFHPLADESQVHASLKRVLRRKLR